MNILLTGGMGFIGSHTAVVLIEAGHDVVLFDNLSNADRSVLDRIETITGRRPVFIPKSRTGWLYNQPAPYFLRLAAR